MLLLARTRTVGMFLVVSSTLTTRFHEVVLPDVWVKVAEAADQVTPSNDCSAVKLVTGVAFVGLVIIALIFESFS